MPVPNNITIGQSSLQVAPLGIGTWAWGDRAFWGYGNAYGHEDIAQAFTESINAGVTLFDTAEVYGPWESERMLGELMRGTDTPVVIASKYLPLPWHLSPNELRTSLDNSLKRLQVECIDLYQIHAPPLLLSIESLMDAMADAVADGKIRTVGVSNFNAQQMREAHATLQRRGVPLVSNQVHYNLLKRTPEVDGVLDACRELNITLIAYSPLAKGLLTGTYTFANPPSGLRYFTFILEDIPTLLKVIDLMRQIGQQHGGKTPAQVALNWLMCQDHVLPIPGAKNAKQAIANAGALGWSLTPDEVEALSRATLPWRS